VDIDQGTEVAVQAEEHQPVMQWELRNPGRSDRSVRIQVGTLADGGWYVRHQGFGSRRFGGKKAAWRAGGAHDAGQVAKVTAAVGGRV
jgi:hypothetical protein